MAVEAETCTRAFGARRRLQGARRAAILLTGHVRTFDLTAPTLDEFLIKANPTYTFSIFCSTRAAESDT